VGLDEGRFPPRPDAAVAGRGFGVQALACRFGGSEFKLWLAVLDGRGKLKLEL